MKKTKKTKKALQAKPAKQLKSVSKPAQRRTYKKPRLDVYDHVQGYAGTLVLPC